MTDTTNSISGYSKDPADNDASPPAGAPEGMTPASLNNVMREIMAVARTQWNDAQWFEYLDGGPDGVAAYVSEYVFKITGDDATAHYHIGRRVRVSGSSDVYATITAVSYSAGATNVTVDASLTNETIRVYTSVLTATNHGLPIEAVQDLVGAMFTGNTETGITVTYQDGDGTIDVVVTTPTDNNFTTVLKDKLDNIEAGADVTANNTCDSPNVVQTTITGNAGSATYASAVTVAARNSTNSTHYPAFYTAQSGNIPTYTDSGLTYNPSTGVMSMVDLTVTSDETLKEHIMSLNEPFKNIMRYKPIKHTWKGRPEDGFFDGLIAQEVQEVKPELVTKNPDTGKLSVNYIKIIPELIACVQELNNRVKELENARI